MSGHYIHGTSPEEQERLSLMNDLLNASSLRALRLRPGERVLDLGSGLGQLTRAMAQRVQPGGRVIGIEREEEQLREARRQATAAGAEPVEFRPGSIDQLPLSEEEWGSFDVAHARFLLEHLPDPLAAVEAMVRAVRTGGRVVLEDDNHELLRLWPPAPEVDRLWQAYIEAWRQAGNDPFVGRRLTSLLSQAGARPRRSDLLYFGGCAGQDSFEAYVANFAGILRGASEAIARSGEWSEEEIEAALTALQDWSRLPDATIWYVTCWAEGVKAG